MSHVIAVTGVVRNVKRELSRGRHVCRFDVPVPAGQDSTTWYKCSLWDENMSALSDAIVVGSNVTVVGAPKTGTYKDAADNTCVAHYLHVASVSFLAGMGRAQHMVRRTPPLIVVVIVVVTIVTVVTVVGSQAKLCRPPRPSAGSPPGPQVVLSLFFFWVLLVSTNPDCASRSTS